MYKLAIIKMLDLLEYPSIKFYTFLDKTLWLSLLRFCKLINLIGQKKLSKRLELWIHLQRFLHSKCYKEANIFRGINACKWNILLLKDYSLKVLLI